MRRLSAYSVKPKQLKRKFVARQMRKSSSCNNFSSSKNWSCREKMIYFELNSLKKKRRLVAKLRKTQKPTLNIWLLRMNPTESSMRRKMLTANRSSKKRKPE